MDNEFEKMAKHMRWQVYALGIITGLALAGIIALIASL